MRAVTLGVGALLSFRMRRQTTPASPGHHEPRGGGRSVLSVSPALPAPPFCCLNHRGCGRHAFRLRCLSGAFHDCPGSLPRPRPALSPDRPRSRRSARERQGGPSRHRRCICAAAFLDVADLWMPTLRPSAPAPFPPSSALRLSSCPVE